MELCYGLCTARYTFKVYNEFLTDSWNHHYHYKELFHHSCSPCFYPWPPGNFWLAFHGYWQACILLLYERDHIVWTQCGYFAHPNVWEICPGCCMYPSSIPFYCNVIFHYMHVCHLVCDPFIWWRAFGLCPTLGYYEYCFINSLVQVLVWK